MFEQALLAGPDRSARSATFALSLTAQVVVAGVLILIPLMVIEGPSMAKLNAALLLAPAPPPPPTIHIATSKNVVKFFDNTRFYQPSRIPDKVAVIDDIDAPQLGNSRSNEGVKGMFGDPSMTGLFTNTQLAPPPEKPKPQAQVKETPKETPPSRVRVGGKVQAPTLIRRVMPIYPQLARAARISGTVKLLGILSRDGRIIQLQVVSGHPLLVTAALDAVKQWVYQPTLLNDEPVEVVAPIDVNFTLGQ